MDTRRLRRIVAGSGLALGLALGFLPAGQAQAATTHIRCHDNAALITAINQANTAGRGRIYLAPGCTYTLHQPHVAGSFAGLPGITGDVHISSLLLPATIRRASDATDNFRIFDVLSGGKLTLNSLIITGGRSDGSGGGIYNTPNGRLTLNTTRVEGNAAVSPSTGGGGVFNQGTMTMRGGTLRNNTSSGFGGGGLLNFGGTARITGATITGNTTTNDNGDGDGGGIDNTSAGTTGTVTLTGATIRGNTAAGDGGGINNDPGSIVHLRLSLVVNNHPDNCAGNVPRCHNTAATQHRRTQHRRTTGHQTRHYAPARSSHHLKNVTTTAGH